MKTYIKIKKYIKERCPFCKSKLQLNKTKHGSEKAYFLKCNKCNTEGPWFKNMVSPVVFWKDRNNSQNLKTELEECPSKFCKGSEKFIDLLEGKTGKIFLKNLIKIYRIYITHLTYYIEYGVDNVAVLVLRKKHS